ncbi:Retrovirus-related Pol polyprotein from transposon 17.6 [Labeo rohita]|uniref:ribonuclease H n=1 Tax=Labeo rohita TaxID=84645 RepID=A0ABQ8L1U0_LABRO|nr:Retrovirus-related Pol polyprotein from transposon 17.6 [Labeo rohita]
MCATTRFPEAVPLRTLKAKVVVKELLKFCTTFGLPKVIQSDQGSNFTSKIFKQVLESLGINHQTSTAHHPESQGALERFHQTLKTMLRRYCMESGKDWVEGLPFLMFAVRESVQESLGFSPAELVFGHTVRGPLKLLSEQLLNPSSKPVPVDDYVTSLREKLHKAQSLAKIQLSAAQSKMKRQFDKNSVKREFNPGDSVLVFLPSPGSILHSKFAGPYLVERKLNQTNYLIATPDRKCKSRVCHVNRLKAYVERDPSGRLQDESVSPPASSVATVGIVSNYSLEEDGLMRKDVPVSSTRLQNSAILQDLQTFLSHLSSEQSENLTSLLHAFPTLFSDVPGRTTVCVHDIDVGDSPPIKQHPYRVNPWKREIMQTEAEYMLRHDLAEPSQSPWSSPCLLVPKPDNTFRFCTDYRKVNKVTKPDSFPLPRMEDCVDRVGSAKYVTKLDLLKGYWQVPLSQRASEISAFVTPDCFLQYKVLAFGMRNAPATFQRMMHKILSDVTNCEVYLDDIVIYSENWTDHVKTLEKVFKCLTAASLTLNLAKCEFAKGVVTYLGKQVGQGAVKPVEAKISAILEFPVPSNKRELRRFLGMSGYYRSFCPNFSALVSPLTDLLSTNRRFDWTNDCELAFNAAKDLLCHAPVLSAPNFKTPFRLQVDASATGAGAVLLQEDESHVEHPVSYFSKKFSKTQQNYSVIEKEALALLLALQHFEVYLGNSPQPIIVYTDHNPLVFISRMSGSNQRLLRWALAVQEYNLDIRHKKGAENIMADALSRV